MKRREQYKHLLNLAANYIMLACETALFAHILYRQPFQKEQMI